MNSREDKLDALLKNKSYQELTKEEQTFVQEELGSEAQYNAMRKVSLALITSKVDLSPDPFIVKSLQQHMHEQRVVVRESFFTWKMPAYATFVLVVVVGVFTWWLGSRQEPSPVANVVEVIKRDTVFLTSAPDTVFKDRVIYRTVFRSENSAAQIQFATKGDDVVAHGRGVNMKEKQDLELLLVSGSR